MRKNFFGQVFHIDIHIRHAEKGYPQTVDSMWTISIPMSVSCEIEGEKGSGIQQMQCFPVIPELSTYSHSYPHPCLHKSIMNIFMHIMWITLSIGMFITNI